MTARSRSRSGNPAVRAAATADATAAPRRGPRLAVAVALIAVLVTGYTVGVMFLPWSTDSTVLVSLLAVPAAVTMIFVPEARSRGLYRWPVVWALGFTSTYPVLVLILGQTWILTRVWVVESKPRLPGRGTTA